MIYTAATPEDLAHNWAAILWRGEYRTQEQAREEYAKHKAGGGTLTFWQFLEHVNWRIWD